MISWICSGGAWSTTSNTLNLRTESIGTAHASPLCSCMEAYTEKMSSKRTLCELYAICGSQFSYRLGNCYCVQCSAYKDAGLSAAREDMFTRASLLRQRFGSPEEDPEADLKSDVEPVSSEDGSGHHEDPNEFLEDLPKEVRDAELEDDVLPPGHDQTRSAENPTQAAKRAGRHGAQGDRPAERGAGGHDSPASPPDSPGPPPDGPPSGVAKRSASRRGRGGAPKTPERPSSAPLAEDAQQSASPPSRAGSSTRHIQHHTPFASGSEQAAFRSQRPSSAAVLKSRSEIDRLKRLSSDTIGARQPKSDLPLMKHSPGSSRANSSAQPTPEPPSPPSNAGQASGSGSDKHGLVKEYRQSLSPMGILGPGNDRSAEPEQPGSRPGQSQGRRGEAGHPEGSPREDDNCRGLRSIDRSGSLHRSQESSRGQRLGLSEGSGSGEMQGRRRRRHEGGPGSPGSRGIARRRSIVARRSGSLAMRMSQLAEQQPSMHESEAG